MKHQIDLADARQESFSHCIALTTGGRDGVSKRLLAQVLVADCDNHFNPTVKFLVLIAGVEKYLGTDLKQAVNIYNEW